MTMILKKAVNIGMLFGVCFLAILQPVIALDIELITEPPNITEVQANAAPISCMVEVEGTDLQFSWELSGVGTLEGNLSSQAVLYTPPQGIDRDWTRAIISIKVKDYRGEESTKSLSIKVLRGENDGVVSTPELSRTSTVPEEENCTTTYNATPDSFREDVWGPTDCSCVKVNGALGEYGFHFDKTQNEAWRRENEAFVKAIKLAKQYHSPEALIYSIKGGENPYADIHRFKIKSGTTVYYQSFEKEADVDYGTCLKKVGDVGKRVYGSMIVERQDIYIIESQ